MFTKNIASSFTSLMWLLIFHFFFKPVDSILELNNKKYLFKKREEFEPHKLKK